MISAMLYERFNINTLAKESKGEKLLIIFIESVSRKFVGAELLWCDFQVARLFEIDNGANSACHYTAEGV